MIPYAFEYRCPSSLDEAKALLRSEPDACLLAGGQTLISAMKLRLANPATLIDIGRIAELSFIRVEEDSILIGAGATHAAVAASREVQNALPALSELAHMIGDPAVRHMGTLGGSIANNDPAADYPAAALALSATIQTTERAIAADDFFTGMFATALGGGEIVTGVRFQIPQRAVYTKFRNQASRYAMVGIFVAKFASEVRVAVTGAASCVFRVPEMEAALSRNFVPEAVAEIAVDPNGLNSDLHGSAEYRAHLVTVMAKRAVAAANAR